MMGTILVIICAFIVVLILYYYLKYFVPLRGKEVGFKYVYVENDGSVRELNDNEKEYLSETFAPTDGGRPYIKSRYNETTPDGNLNGFIHRRRVPKQIIIKN